MRHIKVTLRISDRDSRDMLIALLSEEAYNGFEETEDSLNACVAETDFNEALLKEVTEQAGVPFTTEAIESRNWNAIWEASFEPVVVEGFCTIRAHFHTMPVETPYEVVITPKMSFGTGHHATTQLMMMGTKNIGFEGKSVLDFGTGTGVLAILASMLGAEKVLAIDNDEWSVDNALENRERNAVAGVEIMKASLENIPPGEFDVILANINRHILLQYMNDLYLKLKPRGVLLMSGLLTDDEQIMREAARDAGFEILQVNERAGWISILTEKR